MKAITEYGRYNSTVHTVLMAVEQAHNGWHLSEVDVECLEYAIEDLQAIVDQYKEQAA